MSIVHGGSQVVTVSQGEFIRVTSRGRICISINGLIQIKLNFIALTAQVGEFFGEAFFRFSVFALDGILNGTWHRVVDTQNGTLNQFDLSGSVTAKTRARSLTLSPSF